MLNYFFMDDSFGSVTMAGLLKGEETWTLKRAFLALMGSLWL